MQPLRPEERREFQRLELRDPIEATAGGVEATITQIGILGARVTHTMPLDSEHAELRFGWRGTNLRMKCAVVRAIGDMDLAQPMRQSGVRFLAAVGESGDALRAMLSELVSQELKLSRATADRTEPVEAIDGDSTVRGSDASFLCYRFDRGTWTRNRVFLPEQPDSGFTVDSGVDRAELSRLCSVFEASDAEGRQLIRLFAESSISALLQIPPRK